MADDGEEFVVDKILDKRVRNGKVRMFSVDFTFLMVSRWSTTSPGRALVQRKTHGSRGKTSTVQS